MSSEKRLHPVAMLVGAIRTLRRWVSGLVFPGVVLLVSQGFSLWTVTLFLLGLLVVAALAALWGFLSWRATTYTVTGNSFRLRQGVFQKNERTIPLEHVQSVDIVQGIIQRAFGVVEVRIETAGGGASEPDASLAALDRDAAQTLRREIEGSRRESSEETTGPTILRRLSTRDLLLAGLLLAWLLAIAGTVLAYSGFTLSREGDFLYIKRGLLERREATIPLSRIQAVRISEGVLRQPFGLASLRVESAGYGEDAGVSTTLFPLLPRGEAHALLLRAAPEFAAAPALAPLPRRALRRYVFRATVPALVTLAVAAGLSFFVFESAAGLLGLLLVPPAAAHGWLRYRDAGWALERDRLVVRSRSLARATAIAPRRRLQSRGVVRSPFQRRARLATFLAEVASGAGGAAVQVTDLDTDAAETLAGDLGPGSRRRVATWVRP